MKRLKLAKCALLVCCIVFASQAWSQTTRSLTISGTSFSIESYTVSIKIYKGSTLIENTTVRLGDGDKAEGPFYRSYPTNDYPTSVEVSIQCLPGFHVYFNGQEVFFYPYSYCSYSRSFSLGGADNHNVDNDIYIRCL